MIKFSLGQTVKVRRDVQGERRHIAGWTGTVTRLRIADDGAMVRMDADLPDELRRAGATARRRGRLRQDQRGHHVPMEGQVSTDPDQGTGMGAFVRRGMNSEIARCIAEQRAAADYIAAGGADTAGAWMAVCDWLTEEAILRTETDYDPRS